MNIAKRHAPFGLTLSVLSCAILAAALTGCQFFRKSTSTTKNSTAVSKVMEEEVDTGYSRLQDGVKDATSYLMRLKFSDPLFATGGYAKVSISIEASDSSVFELTQLSVLMGVTIRHADGSVDTKSVAQPIASNKSGIKAYGLYIVKQGDVLEVAIDGIPDVLKNSGKLSVEVFPQEPEESGRDVASSKGYASFKKSVVAKSTEEITQRSVNVSERGLYTFTADFETSTSTTELLVRQEQDPPHPCLAQAGTVGSGTISSTFNGKPWTVALSPTVVKSGGRKCEFYQGFVSVENDAAPATFTSKVAGLLPNETFVEVALTGSSETDHTTAKLGTVEIAPGLPGTRNSYETMGRFEKQKASFVLRGIKGNDGIALKLNGSFIFPMNIPEVAASPFNGSELGATLRYASGPKAGQAVTDATGGPALVFKQTNTPSWPKLSFDEVVLPDLDDGDYEVTLDFPPSFPVGAYASFMLFVTRLGESIEKLDPAIKADFKARDAATGAVVHDWPKADYSTSFNPPARERIAMVAVASAMEELRDVMHVMSNRANPWTGIRTAPSDQNVVDKDAVATCLGANEAPHWSDLTLHYYCQLNDARSCYTGGIRATTGYMQKVQAEETAKGGGDAAVKGAIACSLPAMKVGPMTLPVVTFDPTFKFPTLRQYVFDRCALDPKVAVDKSTGPASGIPGCLARSQNFSFQPGNHSGQPKDDQFGNAAFHKYFKDPERAKVFRYIMEAPTFAFDEKDQQDLINAFYRVTKPTDPGDCAKRSRRAIDREADAGKPSPCEVGHEQDPPRAAAGR